ncbi:hypothetical protein PsYK624_105710 [Phanerochaete sordida]|uniref:Protein kinase domain-containing protein n=1 Tax=Phanerochaete sordida TaxID=48140 RepID=A0A9P3GEV4_9APHY|nr:hypothetical protein PsYK624_105710 [Phanerochaete sordida]
MLDHVARSFSPTGGKFEDASGDIRRGRYGAADDAGWAVPEIGVEHFFDKLLPARAPGSTLTIKDLAEKIIEHLDNEGHYSITDAEWTAFPEDGPRKSTYNEDDTFSSLPDVADAIAEAYRAVCGLTEANEGRTTRLVAEPGKTPEHTHRKSSSKPDGIFLLDGDNANGLLWNDTAACGEFKLVSSIKTLNDDVEKTMWSMHQIMRDDPRRRFAYSFTIEDCVMRLWFCNRSTYAVSEPFHWFTEPEYLVRFFVALMYCSETELGWDPTMERIKVNGETQYKITVHDAKTGQDLVYQTSELLSNVGTFNLRGRATRAWKAKLLADGELTGSDVVIRDNWIDDDRPREADVVQRIIADVPDEESRAALANHTLHVLASGDVFIGTERDLTTTFELETDPTDPTGTRLRMFAIPQVDEDAKAVDRKAATIRQLNSEVKNYHRNVYDLHSIAEHRAEQYSLKAHHRIVYEEVCVTLNAVKDLSEALWAIRAAALVLSIVHSAGWVHRDISAGNILILRSDDPKKSATVKLADFEYAKKCDPTDQVSAAHDIRTGTDAFMSVEVAERGYRFVPSKLDTAESEPLASTSKPANRLLDLGSERTRGNRSVSSHDKKRMLEDAIVVSGPWRYNPLHDMESLWWLCALFVFDKHAILVPEPGKNIPKADLEPEDERDARLPRQRAHSRKVFHNLSTSDRTALLEKDNTLLIQGRNLHPYLRGDIILSLENIRLSLLGCYKLAERNVAAIDRNVADPTYDVFSAELKKAFTAAYQTDFSIQVVSLAQFIAEQGRRSGTPLKRSRADDRATPGAGPSTAASTSARGSGAGSRKKARK